MNNTSIANATCAACKYWDSNDSQNGSCRRRAPQAVVFDAGNGKQFESRFPETTANQWCGEFEAK